MTDSPDTPATVEPTPRDKPANPRRTRGYVPKGGDVEPEQAPTGAAGTSIPTPDEDQSTEGTTDG